MSIRRLLKQYSEKAGWNENSQGIVLCRFIEDCVNEEDKKKFKGFLSEQVDLEEEDA